MQTALRILIFLPVTLYFAWAVSSAFPERFKRARKVAFVFCVLLFAVAMGGMFHYRTQSPDLQSNWIFTFLIFAAIGGVVSIGAVRFPFHFVDAAISLVLRLRKKILAFSQRTEASEESLRSSKLEQLQNSTRRFFSLEVFGWVSLATGPVSAFLGGVTAAQGPEVKRVEVPVEGLDPALDGFTIVQISDLHVGMTILRNYTEQVVRDSLAVKPDLIVLTGDLVDGSVTQLQDHVAPLARLALPDASTHGCYFITGNHEYYSGHQEWIAQFRSMGMRYLENSSQLIQIERQGRKAELILSGVPDPAAEQMEFLKERVFSTPLLRSRSDQNESGRIFKVLLAHRPNDCVQAAEAGYDLQLSGHTHAGQFFPWGLYVPLAHRYNRGLNRYQNRLWVYVNAGTGYWGPPNRFLNPSEITQIVLKKSDSKSSA